ncbi:MAG: tRNA (adenosine(37)-N6)-dimethylallyltransferase MiaA [Deltaproteobacteria bacterium]|nr:tRNA (adenosine(37)-N6)-dimethylallyltransferase MiaA [Deltaproteobacteria bacterium]
MSARVVVIGGPTAAGKSALALEVALQLDGEIVCADSRQVYAGLPIATAAPTAEERARVPHHGYGVLDPAGAPMSAGRFVDMTDQLVADVVARDKVAVLVGGTGLYLRAWRFGLDAPRRPDEPARDMAAFLRRPPRPQARDARYLLVDATLDLLEPRLRERAARMFERGIVEEALALRARLPPEHALLQTIGTAEALVLADGALSLDEAVARTALRSRQYARRQRTWFKKEPWWSAPERVGLPDEHNPR